MPNTFGVVVQDYTEVNFLQRRDLANNVPYSHELAKHRGETRTDIVFGSLCNFVQYFADIGGLDAIVNLLKFSAEASEVLPEESKLAESTKKEKDQSTIRIPYSMMADLCAPFTALG